MEENKIIYRIKQFYWSITAKIEHKDIIYINKYLDKYEIRIFNELSKSEQKHCIKVAHDIERLYRDGEYVLSKEDFIKIGLLHDIGKITYKLNVIHKSIIVILDKLTKSKIKKYKNIKAIYIYYNHGYLGYCILRKYNKYSEKMLYLIKNHHSKDIIGKEIEFLRYCDNLN